MQDANHAGRAVACRKNLRLTEQEHSLTIWHVAIDVLRRQDEIGACSARHVREVVALHERRLPSGLDPEAVDATSGTDLLVSADFEGSSPY